MITHDFIRYNTIFTNLAQKYDPLDNVGDGDILMYSHNSHITATSVILIE